MEEDEEEGETVSWMKEVVKDEEVRQQQMEVLKWLRAQAFC